MEDIQVVQRRSIKLLVHTMLPRNETFQQNHSYNMFLFSGNGWFSIYGYLNAMKVQTNFS